MIFHTECLVSRNTLVCKQKQKHNPTIDWKSKDIRRTTKRDPSDSHIRVIQQRPKDKKEHTTNGTKKSPKKSVR